MFIFVEILFKIAIFCTNLLPMIQPGRLLKFYRELNNLSTEELAECADISGRTLLEIENGNREMRINEMLIFADKLGIKPEKLYRPLETINVHKTEADHVFGSDYELTILNEKIAANLLGVFQKMLEKMK